MLSGVNVMLTRFRYCFLHFHDIWDKKILLFFYELYIYIFSLIINIILHRINNYFIEQIGLIVSSKIAFLNIRRSKATVLLLRVLLLPHPSFISIIKDDVCKFISAIKALHFLSCLMYI